MAVLHTSGRILSAVILFLAGLFLGALFFAPWEMVWDKGLAMADEHLDGVRLKWVSIPEAGIASVRIKGLALSTAKGDYVFSEAAVRMGFDPFLDIRVVTGTHALVAHMDMGGEVDLDGGVDVGAVAPGRGLSGAVNLHGKLDFGGLNAAPPQSGTLDLTASTLAVMGGVSIEALQARTDLDGPALSLRSFSIAKPVPVKATGTVHLDYANFMNSRFDVSGTWTLGDQQRPFTRRGALSSLM